MNVFSRFGIREVADVVFYSITRVGTEEFYLPVLYLDTLKISTYDKGVTSSSAHGGKGNSNLVSWSYSKDSKLKLEDALFSETSLDIYMNGRVMAKMSDWTSAIAKLTVANKYGRLNYSTKSAPSPELTNKEWEIVYRCAQRAGYDPRTGSLDGAGANRLDGYENHTMKYVYDEETPETKDINSMVAENRWLLKKNYTNRTLPSIYPTDLAAYLDINTDDFESVSVIMKPIEKNSEWSRALTIHRLDYGERYESWSDVIITYRRKSDAYDLNVVQNDFEEPEPIVAQLHYGIEKTTTGYQGVWAYIVADEDNSLDTLKEVFYGWNKDEETPAFHIGNLWFLNHIMFFIFPNYLEKAIENLCWCDIASQTETAMPQKIIDTISDEVTDFAKLGKFENDLYEAKCIDRMESCIVTNPNGLKIDLQKQLENIKKYYKNDKSTFTIFYDKKTMQPFMGEEELDKNITEQKCVRIYSEENIGEREYLAAIKKYLEGHYDQDWINSLTLQDVVINKVVNVFESKYSIPIPTVNIVSGDDYAELSGEVDVPNENVEWTRTPNYYLVYFTVVKRDLLILKYGTSYLKLTRTVDDDNTDLTYIGSNLSIDADSFPGEYMITCNTVMRSQVTGEDMNVQILINRASVLTTTKLNLLAKGEPTTFSMTIDILAPYADPTDPSVEFLTFETENDEVNGGTRIVPKYKTYTKTTVLRDKEKIMSVAANPIMY